MLTDSVQRFCKRTLCGQCSLLAECFDTNIAYSEIGSNQPLWPAPLQDAHYIRLLRKAVMIKAPLVRYDKTSIPEQNSSIVLAPTLTFIAVLPVSRRGQPNSLFGILLQRISSTSYVRLSKKPVLLQEHIDVIDQADFGAYTVHDANPNHAKDSIAKIIPDYAGLGWPGRYAKFKLHSATLVAHEWRCKAQDSHTAYFGPVAQFLLPRSEEHHFSVSISFRDVNDPKLTGVIVLGNSISQMQLLEVKLLQRQNSFYSFSSQENDTTQRCMNFPVQIPETEDFLDVTLRKLPVTELELSRRDSFNVPFRVSGQSDLGFFFVVLQYQYRLDVVRSSKKEAIRESSSQPRHLELLSRMKTFASGAMYFGK
ncbi:hypothetical protein J3E73DRAFT_232799 [Bipolaris maydis]|nr:hypothetical protein J3E73DRAFT_232799 [Bipolaris maydis]